MPQLLGIWFNGNNFLEPANALGMFHLIQLILAAAMEAQWHSSSCQEHLHCHIGQRDCRSSNEMIGPPTVLQARLQLALDQLQHPSKCSASGVGHIGAQSRTAPVDMWAETGGRAPASPFKSWKILEH